MRNFTLVYAIAMSLNAECLFPEKILNPNWYVRDLYFFKRSQYPQLRLVEMRMSDAFNALQKQELVKRFMEIGKVHLTWAILKNVDMVSGW